LSTSFVEMVARISMDAVALLRPISSYRQNLLSLKGVGISLEAREMGTIRSREGSRPE